MDHTIWWKWKSSK